MNRTTCPNKMVDTCCENYDDCTLSFYDKDAEIKRLNEKIEFLARTNMLYSDWEHRETQVTSDLIRKGIEEHKINAELRAEMSKIPMLEKFAAQSLVEYEGELIFSKEKFAELIVKECASVALMSNGNNLYVCELIKEHFGVEE